MSKSIKLTLGKTYFIRVEDGTSQSVKPEGKDNSITFSKNMKAEGLTRFEDVMEEFRDKFNDSWIKE